MEDNKRKRAIEIIKGKMKAHGLKSLSITDDSCGVKLWEYDGDVPFEEFLGSKEHEYAYEKGYVMGLISNFEITNEDLENDNRY